MGSRSYVLQSAEAVAARPVGGACSPARGARLPTSLLHLLSPSLQVSEFVAPTLEELDKESTGIKEKTNKQK